MITVCLAAALFATPALSANAGALTAGVARVDITPPLEMKASLGGYGERMSRPANGVHDRIWAKALVLRQSDRKFVLVTADMLALPPGFKDAVLARLNEVLGAGGRGPGTGTGRVTGTTGGKREEEWTNDEVMLLASHSHTSIDMTALNPKNDFGIPQMGIFHKALYERTRDLFAKVISDAAKTSAACRVGTQSIHLEGWNHNRRRDNIGIQQELTITRVDVDAGPLAVLVNWSAHPTFMDADAMEYSGDWPGHLQRTLEALIGHGVTAMYYNGAEGDQSPIARPDSGGDWEKAERYGREMGLQVWDLWKHTRTTPNVRMQFHLEPIPLPDRIWHPDFMKTGGAEYGLSDTAIRTIVERLVPVSTHSVSLRLGDLIIAGVPGELASSLGDELKDRVRKSTGARYVVVGGLADEWISYMLSPAEYHKGGYEASMSFYGDGLGPVIVDGVVKGAAELK